MEQSLGTLELENWIKHSCPAPTSSNLTFCSTPYPHLLETKVHISWHYRLNQLVTAKYLIF